MKKEIYKDYLENHLRRDNLLTKKVDADSFFTSLFKDRIEISPNDKILELASGNGFFLNYCKGLGVKDVMGVDISAQNVAYIKTNITKNVVLSDVTNFFEKDQGKYDMIYSKDLIEHLTPDAVFNLIGQCRKALNPQGKLILLTINASSSPLVHNMARYYDFTHETSFTEWSIRQVLVTAGFKKIKIIPTRPTFKNMRFIGKLHHIIYTMPSYFFRKLHLKLNLFDQIPTVMHWHMTIIAEK
jgi:2-polyprenyl-3-methyl-5-hydroxy-6-metoxy-1,4-benzoquinol methylase